MARKSYPETPQEEADRINRASGDPTGITAAQVANMYEANLVLIRPDQIVAWRGKNASQASHILKQASGA